MARSYNKEFFVVLTAISLTALLFMSDKVFAETKVKNKIEINGVEYINEEVTTTGSIKTDIDVHVKNNQGNIKYNVNGKEKNIQISKTENKTQDTKANDPDEDKKTDPTPTNKPKIVKNEDKQSRNLIEAVIQTVDSLISRIGDLFN